MPMGNISQLTVLNDFSLNDLILFKFNRFQSLLDYHEMDVIDDIVVNMFVYVCVFYLKKII